MKRYALYLFYRAIEIRFGHEAFEWWVWNQTPHPFGAPSREQLLKAFKWIIGLNPNFTEV